MTIAYVCKEPAGKIESTYIEVLYTYLYGFMENSRLQGVTILKEENFARFTTS
jgi:hypothetical protein